MHTVQADTVALDFKFEHFATENGNEVLGCFRQSGLQRKKRVWADYEQLFGVVVSTFCGQKKIVPKKKNFLF